MSKYIFPGKLTQVDYPAFLSQHDVVYQGPATEGIDGLPIGNGDLGAIVWTPPDRLQFNINKVDLFDDGPDGALVSWSDADNEVASMPRHAGSLSISNGLPIFDRLYLTDFKGRLRLAEAQVDWQAHTPFSNIAAETLISQAAKVLVVHYQDETEEALPRLIELSRWGTRGLLHWYSVIKRDVPLSLLGTQAGADDEHVWINQPLRQMSFVIAARVKGPVSTRLLHRRAGIFESEPVRQFKAEIYVAVAHSEETNDPLTLAIKRVDDAYAQGWEALQKEHRRTWRKFWEASFVDLPPEQDYIENLWYLNSYHVGSACRGTYPPNHIHALWAWNRDVFPWALYYHWNDQQHIYSLHSIGHPELAMPYFQFRRGMLDKARQDAQNVHNCRGAYYSDVANRKGYQETNVGTSHNLTPGPQIAAQFWQHYQYTLDKDFLKEYAYPVIREVACFYMDFIKLREDGRYTFNPSQPYEGVLFLRDTLTDLAHSRQVFRIFLEASQLLGEDKDLAQECQEKLGRLAEYVTAQVSTQFAVQEPPLQLPNWGGDAVPVHFKDVQPGDPTMPIWLLGYKVPGSPSVHGQEIPDGTPIHEGSRNPLDHTWIFTSTNISPVFPSNQIGLDQAGTPEFETAINTARSLGQDSASFSWYIVARARLGMVKELQQSLGNWPQRFQLFPQGFYHYFGVGSSQYAAAPNRQIDKVRLAGTDEFIYWPKAISNHTSLEGGPVLQLAINEMLLQSYSGRLRIFPAVPDEWEGQFRLHAAGGFVVSAVKADGEVTYAVVESRFGLPCLVVNPFKGQAINLYVWDARRDAWLLLNVLHGNEVAFPSQSGEVYLLLPEGKDPGSLNQDHIEGHRNTRYKELGTARLGIPRGF